MRVAFVSPFVIQGGAERYLALLLDGLDRSWIARIFFLADGPLVDDLRGRGYPLEVVPTSAGPVAIVRSSLRLRRELRRLGPDVVHADGIKGALVATIATAGTGLPVVWLKCDFSRDGWLARAVARRCRSIAAVSKAVTETFGDDALAKTTVVPFGLPEAGVDRASRARRARRGDRCRRARDRALRAARPAQGSPGGAGDPARAARAGAGGAGRLLRRRRPGASGLPRGARRRDRGGRPEGRRRAAGLPPERRRADQRLRRARDSERDQQWRPRQGGLLARRARGHGRRHSGGRVRLRRCRPRCSATAACSCRRETAARCEMRC